VIDVTSSGDETNATASQPTAALALVDPTGEIAGRGTLVATLSPSEIEDLRSRVRSTIGANDTRPTSTIPAPVPAQTLTNVPVQIETRMAASADGTPPPKTNPLSVAPEPEPAIAEMVVASLEPASPDPVALEPIGIEPGIRSTGKLAFPTRNPELAESVAIAALQASDAQQDEDLPEGTLMELALANLPLPVPSPLKQATTALNQTTAEPAFETGDQQDSVQNASAPMPEAYSGLAPRTISLDRYSAPQENTTTLGQFALASDIKIRDLADVRAPAYGRNVIREVPQTILIQGFNLQAFGSGQNIFTGRAVTAMKFAHQRVN